MYEQCKALCIGFTFETHHLLKIRCECGQNGLNEGQRFNFLTCFLDNNKYNVDNDCDVLTFLLHVYGYLIRVGQATSGSSNHSACGLVSLSYYVNDWDFFSSSD